MTALVLEQIVAARGFVPAVRLLGKRLARQLDRLVKARAAREIPEWKMRAVRAQIARYRGR